MSEGGSIYDVFSIIIKNIFMTLSMQHVFAILCFPDKFFS